MGASVVCPTHQVCCGAVCAVDYCPAGARVRRVESDVSALVFGAEREQPADLSSDLCVEFYSVAVAGVVDLPVDVGAPVCACGALTSTWDEGVVCGVDGVDSAGVEGEGLPAGRVFGSAGRGCWSWVGCWGRGVGGVSSKNRGG